MVSPYSMGNVDLVLVQAVYSLISARRELRTSTKRLLRVMTRVSRTADEEEGKSTAFSTVGEPHLKNGAIVAEQYTNLSSSIQWTAKAVYSYMQLTPPKVTFRKLSMDWFAIILLVLISG